MTTAVFQAISTDSELPRYDERVLLWVLDREDSYGWQLGRRVRTDGSGEVYVAIQQGMVKLDYEYHRNVKFFCRLPPNPTGESI